MTGANAPEAAPRVLAGRIRVTSDPGEDGQYTVGDPIRVAVKMSRPVRSVGAASAVRLQVGERTREAALVWIVGSADVGDAGIGVPGHGSGDTLVFRYVVQEHDEDSDGIAIRSGGLRLNGGRLLDAVPGGRGLAAAFRLNRALAFADHRVQGVLPRVVKIERLGNLVWVYFARDL